MLEAVGEQLGLRDADGIERGVAVTVAERERTARDARRGLAVPHEQHRRRAGRRGEAVLAKAFGRDLGLAGRVGGGHGREVSAR